MCDGLASLGFWSSRSSPVRLRRVPGSLRGLRRRRGSTVGGVGERGGGGGSGISGLDGGWMIPFEVFAGSLADKKILKPSVEAVTQIGWSGSSTGSATKTAVPEDSAQPGLRGGHTRGVSGAVAFEKDCSDEGGLKKTFSDVRTGWK